MDRDPASSNLRSERSSDADTAEQELRAINGASNKNIETRRAPGGILGSDDHKQTRYVRLSKAEKEEHEMRLRRNRKATCCLLALTPLVFLAAGAYGRDAVAGSEGAEAVPHAQTAQDAAGKSRPAGAGKQQGLLQYLWSLVAGDSASDVARKAKTKAY